MSEHGLMQTPRAPIALMACESGRKFGEEVANRLGQELIPSTETWFACGEGKIEIKANVRGHDLYVFQTVIGQQDTRSIYDRFVMLLHAIEAGALADAQFITAVLPYYSGARQDKKKGGIEKGSALDYLLACYRAGAGRVMTVEIHNDAIAEMFNSCYTNLENVFLTKHLVPWLKDECLVGEVVVSLDVGYLERARVYAELLSADLAALSKERNYSKPNQVFHSTLIGDVFGKNILLVDDIIDTAGSVVASIEELKHRGGRDIIVVCIHPVFSKPAWKRLNAVKQKADLEGWRFQVVGAGTVIHEETPDWYHCYPIENVLSQVVEKINSRGSVTGI